MSTTEQVSAPITPVEAPKIIINVCGAPGVGTSTVAMFIGLCLDKVGIDAAIINESGDTDALNATFQERLKAIAAAGTEVDVLLVQLPKEPTFKESQLILPQGAGKIIV